MQKISTLVLIIVAAFQAMNASGNVSPTTVTLAPSSAPCEITATNTEIITATPTGTLTDPLYCASSKTWLVHSSAVASMSDNNGYAGAMVRTDDAVYIRNMMSEYDSSITYWVKGDVQTDGSVTFKFPQHVYHSSTTDIYIAQLTPSLNGSTVTFSVDESNCDLRMKWEDNRLVQIMPNATDAALKQLTGVVGMVNGNGAFVGYAEQGISYKIVDNKPLTPPAGLQSRRYVMNYKTGDNESRNSVIAIGTDGDDVWFKGLNPFLPDAWVKGTMKDGTVSIPATYTGVVQGYLTYVTGLSSDNKQLISPFSITKTAEGYAADGTIFTSLGNETVSYHDNRVLIDAVMTPYIEKTRTPATPVIDTSSAGTEAWTPEEGMGALGFTLEAVDTEGNPLDQSKLYYQVFKNGNLYTFKAEDYGHDADMTDIPYNFGSELIYNFGDGYIFVFFLDDMDSIGVRAVYKDGDNTTYSEIATHVFRQSGIEAIGGDSPVVSTEYLNLNGQKVSNPVNGVYIKLTRHADGSVKATKTIIRK